MPYRNNYSGRVIPLHGSTNEPIETVDFDSSLERLSMDETCARLSALKVPYKRLTAFHLKVGLINHYPTTGVTMLDGQQKLPERGFESLLQALRERHVLRSTTPSPPPTSSANTTTASSADDNKIVLIPD